MEEWKKDRIGSCVQGKNPTLILRMKSGFAVIGDTQFLPGYCVLLGYPRASSLNELTLRERSQFLLDMTLIGDAIMKTCDPLRINYSILMNLDTYLHAHIQPRYDWEPEDIRCRPAFFHPKEIMYAKEYEYTEEKYGDLKRRIADNLTALIGQSDY